MNGYTDTSGTQQYNQGLSVRRAKTVASANYQRWRAENADRPSKVSATHIFWCRQVLVCANRKIAVSKSSYANALTQMDGGCFPGPTISRHCFSTSHSPALTRSSGDNP